MQLLQESLARPRSALLGFGMVAVEEVKSHMEMSWRQLGACRGLDAALFYPPSDDEAGPAKDICARCPVRMQCLDFALETRESDGIWGGTTERERRRMIRQRRKRAAA